MHNDVKEIVERLQEVLLSGRWIANTNYREQLYAISWQQAIQRVGRLNSIAALTYHINYYLAGLCHAFHNQELLIKDEYSFDVPEIQDAAAWLALVNEFERNAKAFIAAVEQLPAKRWDTIFIDKKYGNYRRNIEGVIEHCYYHLGQVVLIRKLLQD
ncbi:DinB family protein [Sphingobacterium oryzagri]|uniref:DinB family protein n=1 Tax=Sphingobacterium oryzagri TaxID=3025669 RepID=A0ABY7WQ78_9SPHI|nr:DinB family protein [Sphingobacterium sp. KACC 22765]WDF70704.1 DinB family protein [Sphingobacterium sp. KACC 22765]